MLRRRSLLLALSTALSTTSCATGPSSASAPRVVVATPVAAATPPAGSVAPVPAPAPVVAPEPAPRVEEVSVHPGINDAYQKEQRVGPWVRRLERDGREVHDRRVDILRALALQPGMAVADVGAGTGLFTLEFARAVGDRGRVYAVDVMPKFLEHIDHKAARAGLSQVRTVQAGERDVGLDEAAVDLVFMSDVYHHIEYPRAYLASLRRALRPGGRLVLIDFRREEGQSDAWILEHVRAGQAQVVREFTEAGFVLEQEVELLRENYFLRFRRP
ncbi:MAG: class I SAM-dependent methyltransferase [Myxococcales bacterium]|nr:class I SAM-dependent methyltransferase [Myxococcales bacterium]